MGVVPYRDTVPRGLFATRDPVRPNPIGLSCVRLIGIEGNILRVAELDILNGTPLLDLKTYVPDYDAYPLGRVRWLGNRVLDVVEVDGRFQKPLEA
ncbi:MAG: TrmO family methyltransferase [Verrucomicrobiota bacterium]